MASVHGDSQGKLTSMCCQEGYNLPAINDSL